MEDSLNRLLLKLGITPLYAATFIMLLASLFEAKKIKFWEELPSYMKRFIIMVWISAVMLLISSIIVFFSD